MDWKEVYTRTLFSLEFRLVFDLFVFLGIVVCEIMG